MVAIYLTGITIAMLNIAGIFFIITMSVFSRSKGQLKKANLKKSSTLNDIMASDTNKITAVNSKNSILDGKKSEGAGAGVKNAKTAAGTAAGAALGAAAAASVDDKNPKNSGDFNNIDEILNDLDLSDFDNLDLDDL